MIGPSTTARRAAASPNAKVARSVTPSTRLAASDARRRGGRGSRPEPFVIPRTQNSNTARRARRFQTPNTSGPAPLRRRGSGGGGRPDRRTCLTRTPRSRRRPVRRESRSEPLAIPRLCRHADASSWGRGRSPDGDEGRIKGGERALLNGAGSASSAAIACRTARRSRLSISAARPGSRTQKMARTPRIRCPTSTIRKLPTTANTYAGCDLPPAIRESPTRRSRRTSTATSHG